MTTKDRIEQLIGIYYNEEDWHKNKLSYEEAYKYHDKLYRQGNIFTYEESGIVLGYCEFWRINFEQWGRYVCDAPISGYLEDISSGYICVVNNVWINKEHRRGKVFREMRNKFYRLNADCDYYVGHALRKTASQPIKVFKRKDLKSRLFKEGVI
jgi:hypothetical protein